MLPDHKLSGVSGLLAVACLLLVSPPSGADLCTTGSLTFRGFTLTPSVHYWLTDPFSCAGYVSHLHLCYRGGEVESVLNLAVSVWSVEPSNGRYTLQGELVVHITAEKYQSDDSCIIYHFGTLSSPLLTVREGNLFGFSFNSSLTGSGLQEPLLFARISLSRGYLRFAGARGVEISEQELTSIGAHVALGVDIDALIPTSTSVSTTSSSSLTSKTVKGRVTDAGILTTTVSLLDEFAPVSDSIGLSTILPSSTPPAIDSSGTNCRDIQECVWSLLALLLLIIVMLAVGVVVLILVKKPCRKRTSKNCKVNRSVDVLHSAQPVERHDDTHQVVNPVTSSVHLPGTQLNEERPYCQIAEDDTLQYKNLPRESLMSSNAAVDYKKQLQDQLNSLHDSTSYAVLHPEDGLYEFPSSNESGIQSQLKKWCITQIDPQSVKCEQYIGAGHFANVYKGEWQSLRGVKDVAVKILKNCDMASEDRVAFLQEVAIMAQFQHPNVVKLYGTVLDDAIVMMVLEYTEKRDLLHFIQTLKPKEDEPVPETLPRMMVDFCHQIASGMLHLHCKCFVHRDLAARNVFVNLNNVCKIGDFGMARDLDGESLYFSSGGSIPIKWTAPEAILHRKYSSASDMWSFGVVLYEIWSMGQKPFDGKLNEEVPQFLMAGNRLPPPPGCPRKIYQFMILSWHPEPDIRPSFRDATGFLSQPKDEVLCWTNLDKETHPECSVLGADLSCSENLYKDLQETYVVIS